MSDKILHKFTERYWTNEYAAVIGCVVLHLCALFMIIIFIHSMYHVHYKDFKLHTSVKATFTTALSFNLIFVIGQYISYALPILLQYTVNCFPSQITAIPLAISRLFTYGFFLSRLHTSFAESTLRYSPILWCILQLHIFLFYNILFLQNVA